MFKHSMNRKTFFHMNLPPQFVFFVGWTLVGTALHAEEPVAEIIPLQKAAANFVVAYNHRDAAAVAALFTEKGEMTDFRGNDRVSGRAQIRKRYGEIFAENPPHIAVEVSSIRFVAPHLAIEDGVVHLTPSDDETAPARSTAYTAVLIEEDDGEWRIASTRSLGDVSGAAGQLAELAATLKGEWTHRNRQGVRLDLAFGWDPSGKSLAGEMLTTIADAPPQSGTIRISWDSLKKQIVSWIFDSTGGFTHSIWTPSEDGWLIRSEGTTGHGEALTASHKLTTRGEDTLIWTATHRVIAGENAPDQSMRIVRQTPTPGKD